MKTGNIRATKSLRVDADPVDNNGVGNREYNDIRYCTGSEVDTISGSLQTNIDGKSDLTHLHDDRYYTETELNNGQLDTRYYTELEVDDLITTVSGKLDDHNELNNLDYASAGHTGFQPSGDYATDSELTTLSGNLQTNIDGKSDTDHIHDDRYYTESEIDTISGSLNTAKSDVGHSHTESDISDLDKYTQAEVDTISGTLQTNIDGKSNTGHTHDDRYYMESEVDTISGTLSSEIDYDISTHTSSADAHHNEDHTVASHSDTTATGAQVNTLVGGSNTTLHKHDTLYYTESEVDTISGTLQTNIDGKSDTNHTHDNRYYTESEVDTISGTLQTDIDTRAVSSGAEHDNFSDFIANEHIDHSGVTITAGTGLTGGGNITATRTLDVDVGITNDKIVQIDDLDAADNDYCKLTASGIEGRSYSEVLGDIGAPSVTTAAWSKSIGSGGDYATWAAMIADMPDLIAHEVTVTIKAGTTLTETCDLKNKHGLTSDAAITVQAEKYFPTSGALPTADSATATTLRDAALATAALGNDYFNGCWVFIVDGTGTDNGFVPITDYVDATGDVVVASWPGTQPDNTSRYLIVGALIDGEATRDENIDIRNCTVGVSFWGIGITDADKFGVYSKNNSYVYLRYSGIDKSDRSGIYTIAGFEFYGYYCGLVDNNTDNSGSHGGIRSQSMLNCEIWGSGISDNKQRGIYILNGGFVMATDNFGDANGLWGAYAFNSGQIHCLGTECSGSSGNHSDPGTAGTANADQASAY